MLTSIIGCGNPTRRDDGAGIFVIQQLLKNELLLNRADLKLIDAGTSGMDVMLQAKGSSALIIIDANKSGSEPGAIFKVPGEELENLPVPSYTLHDFRWDHAIYSGKMIYKDNFPRDICVFLIEAKDLDFGLGLSPEVKAAAERVVQMILQLLAENQSCNDERIAENPARQG